MVEPPAAADFSDELFMLDFTDDSAGAGKEMRNPNPSRRRPAHFLQEIFDAAVDSLPVFAAEEGSQGGGDDEDEEEELEWLANKDAFPGLETSFDLSAQSLSSEGGGGGGGGSGATAAAASGERPSPVSVLTSALLFRAPAKLRSKGLRRRRKALTTFVSPPPAAPSAAAAMEGGKGEKRKCRHCESSETPQWRAGPEGPKTLCNACGVRYKSGRLVPEYRPANSPTYSASIHSNSHRRVVEMRRQKYGSGGGHGRGRRGSRRPPLLVDGLAAM